MRQRPSHAAFRVQIPNPHDSAAMRHGHPSAIRAECEPINAFGMERIRDRSRFCVEDLQLAIRAAAGNSLAIGMESQADGRAKFELLPRRFAGFEIP